MNKPTITIVHSLPGRLRAVLSVLPYDAVHFTESVMGHDGLECVTLTQITRSLLVHYDPREVTREEVLIRLAMALSLDINHSPVVVWETPENEAMANSAAYAGLIAGAALAIRFITGKSGVIEKIAAGATGASVLEHGWREVREQGGFDPEVLSLVYLAAAAMRGDYLRGALATWAMTFGRHLVGDATNGVEVRAMPNRTDADGIPRYELTLHQGVSKRAPLFSILQSLTGYVTAAGGGAQEGLLEQLRHVSQAHGEIVEGLSGMRQGVPMRFQ